jgi:peptidoglycan/LPS O-acetylase OafA/YrhL
LWREPSLRALFPLIILAAIGGAFMSQQLWGSTYAIWPLLALLVAEMLAALDRFAARAAPQWFVPALAALISITLLICGGFYTASEDRLSYINLPDAPVEHSAFPELAGMATPGPYLPQLDELLRYAASEYSQG